MLRTLLLISFALLLTACPFRHHHHDYDSGFPIDDAGVPPPIAGSGGAGSGGSDGGPNIVDAGTYDAAVDSGAVDAGQDASVDASLPDSGAEDAGQPEDASVDAGIDAGPPILDSGIEDAAVDSGVDAGELDSGPSEPDASIADSGVDSGQDAGPQEPPCVGPPGLYQDDDCQVLAQGVRKFTPKFALWSDGAIKTRWVYLPPGGTVSAANADRWVFPVGTRLYKEFRSQDGAIKVETRLFQKVIAGAGINTWDFHSYEWSGDQRTATINDLGATNVHGTGLDIPTHQQCSTCHSNGVDPGLGFGAIQLNHPAAGVTLDELLSSGILVDAAATTVETATIPARDTTELAALGYLHANCGHCHGGTTPRAGQDLSARVGLPILNQPVFTAAVCRPLTVWIGARQVGIGPFALRIAGGASTQSGILARAAQRGNSNQMPPLATNVVDVSGLQSVATWIDGLPTCQ